MYQRTRFANRAVPSRAALLPTCTTLMIAVTAGSANAAGPIPAPIATAPSPDTVALFGLGLAVLGIGGIMVKRRRDRAENGAGRRTLPTDSQSDRIKPDRRQT
jgi:hypothetical protein